jgi:hypothetical protein
LTAGAPNTAEQKTLPLTISIQNDRQRGLVPGFTRIGILAPVLSLSIETPIWLTISLFNGTFTGLQLSRKLPLFRKRRDSAVIQHGFAVPHLGPVSLRIETLRRTGLSSPVIEKHSSLFF